MLRLCSHRSTTTPLLIMKNTKLALQHSQELLHDLQALAVEAAKLLGEAAGEQTDQAIAALREQFETAQDQFLALYGQAKKKTIAGVKYTDETVRSNPYQSIAVAAGVGLVIGLLLGRSSKD